MTCFFLAWQFLTILPGWRGKGEATAQLLGQSMACYPLVGLLLGLILWGSYWLFSLVFPRMLVDGVVILLLTLLTGAIHLDGLADTLDGMASGKTSEQRLQIMKDHQVGTFGVVGLTSVLGIKFLALHSLPEDILGKSILVSLVLSRWSMVQLLYRVPYARAEGGLGKAFKENLKKKQMVWATTLSLILAAYLLRFWGVVLWLAVGVCTLGLQLFFQRKIGGVTGDILGATNEANEVLVLLMINGIFHGFF